MKKLLLRYKYKIIFTIAAAVVIAIIFALFSIDNRANSENLSFIRSFGWTCEDSPTDISHFTVPDEALGIYAVHAGISALDGSSLTDYAGCGVTRYSYTVLNHRNSDGGNVRADIFVYKSAIIAADISDLSPGGNTVPISDTTMLAPSEDAK